MLRISCRAVDKGYDKSEESVASEEADISVVVHKPMTSNAIARGRIDKADCAYDSDKDVYVCPEGNYSFTGQQDGKALGHIGRVPASMVERGRA
jgi:hypothetical protein